MNLDLSSIQIYCTSLIKDNVQFAISAFEALTDSQKKVFAVVAVPFAALAVVFVVTRCFCKSNTVDPEDTNSNKNGKFSSIPPANTPFKNPAANPLTKTSTANSPFKTPAKKIPEKVNKSYPSSRNTTSVDSHSSITGEEPDLLVDPEATNSNKNGKFSSTSPANSPFKAPAKKIPKKVNESYPSSRNKTSVDLRSSITEEEQDLLDEQKGLHNPLTDGAIPSRNELQARKISLQSDIVRAKTILQYLSNQQESNEKNAIFAEETKAIEEKEKEIKLIDSQIPFRPTNQKPPLIKTPTRPFAPTTTPSARDTKNLFLAQIKQGTQLKKFEEKELEEELVEKPGANKKSIKSVIEEEMKKRRQLIEGVENRKPKDHPSTPGKWD